MDTRRVKKCPILVGIARQTAAVLGVAADKSDSAKVAALIKHSIGGLNEEDRAVVLAAFAISRNERTLGLRRDKVGGPRGLGARSIYREEQRLLPELARLVADAVVSEHGGPTEPDDADLVLTVEPGGLRLSLAELTTDEERRWMALHNLWEYHDVHLFAALLLGRHSLIHGDMLGLHFEDYALMSLRALVAMCAIQVALDALDNHDPDDNDAVAGLSISGPMSMVDWKWVYELAVDLDLRDADLMPFTEAVESTARSRAVMARWLNFLACECDLDRVDHAESCRVVVFRDRIRDEDEQITGRLEDRRADFRLRVLERAGLPANTDVVRSGSTLFTYTQE